MNERDLRDRVAYLERTIAENEAEIREQKRRMGLMEAALGRSNDGWFEAKAVLGQIEPIFRGNGVSKVCPICKWPKVGHATDCRLKKAIGS